MHNRSAGSSVHINHIQVQPRSRSKTARGRRKAYRTNHGQPGVVYILENPGLRDGWWKIGCSTRSGAARASDLNAEATTGTPGIFRCVFEHRTVDCGLAEERVFAELAHARNGKWGQEYFAIELAIAKEIIQRVGNRVDEEMRPPPPPPPPPPRPIQPSPPAPVQSPPTPALSPATTAAVVVIQPRAKARLERYCGHCRTLFIPKSRLRWLVRCPNCGLSI